MTTPIPAPRGVTDGLVERLAKRWLYDDHPMGLDKRGEAMADARWWLNAIAEALENERGVPCHEISAEWLRTEAERR